MIIRFPLLSSGFPSHDFSLTSPYLSYIMYYIFMLREVACYAVEHQAGQGNRGPLEKGR
jgi:hypothetical protein